MGNVRTKKQGSKQLLEFIFTSFSHVWCNGDKATVLMWAATPGTSLFKPFQAFPYSFTVLKRQLLTPDVAVGGQRIAAAI